jgi:S1-C subfamily serine protease
MQRNGCFIALALLLTLVVGGIGGALVGGLAALSIERGYEPPVISAWIPTQTPTPTMVPTATPIPPTETPVPTLTPTPVPPTPTPVPTATPSFADVVARVQPSVVTVILYFEGDLSEPVSIGTGVALFEENIIVTNHHVIEGADVIRVQTSTDEEFSAELVGSDFFSDLAVLQVEDTTFTPLNLQDAIELRIGDPVFTVGAALGDFRNSVTGGIVSGLNRSVVVPEAGFAYESLIQTDAAINPGNSGGPLLNNNGEVIGINTLIVRGDSVTESIGEGLGFAIAGATVRDIVQTLIAEGEVQRPFFGIRHELITFVNVFEYGLTDIRGEVVLGVEPFSPADTAGIEQGDVLLEIDGEEINEDNPFINLLMRHTVGDTIQVLLLRDDNEITVSVTLTERT